MAPRTPIPKAELIKLEKPGAINTFVNGIVPYFMVDKRYGATFALFENCEFERFVHFEDANLNVGLKFEECDFNKPLILKDINAKGYLQHLNLESENIVFRKCNFKGIVKLIGNSVVEKSIVFEECTFKDGLFIDGLTIEVESLKIKKCTIEKKLDISNVKINDTISISSSTITTFSRFENIESEFLNFTNSNVFTEKLLVHSSKFIQGINFNGGKFKEVELLLNTTEIRGLDIIDSAFEKTFFVNYHSGQQKPVKGINYFYLSDSVFSNGIYVSGKTDIFANEPIVEQIIIVLSAKLKGDIVFRDLHIGVLNFGGYNSSANLMFMNLFINQIRIKGLINNAGLIFSGIKASFIDWLENKGKVKTIKESALYISDSNFGKAQFFQTDFSSFQKVSFHNNIIIDISTSLMKWFTPDKLDDGDKEIHLRVYKDSIKRKEAIERVNNNRNALISKYKSIQETYRQLKFASQKQMDAPSSLEFQKHEMNYYRKIISLQKPRKWDEYLILLTNQSNDFGQSWRRALTLLVCFSFVFYIPIGFLISDKLDYSRFLQGGYDIGVNLRVVFYDNLKLWLVLLNPAHRVSDLSKNIDCVSSWVYFWDIFSRVIVSYFLFQTISAFRKFNK